SRPKQLRQKRMITTMLPSVGARFCISQRPPRDALADGAPEPAPKPGATRPPSRPPAGERAGAGACALAPPLVSRCRLAHVCAVGGLSRPTSRLTVGLTSATPLSSGATSQLKYTSVRPSTPWALALLTTLLRLWLPQSR